MFPSLFLAAAVFTSFPGGAAGRVEWAAPDHVRVGVPGQADQDGRNRQASWYYFRIDGAKDRELTVELTDLLGEYNYRPGTHPVRETTRPVFSTDNETWTHFSAVEWDDARKELRLRLRPDADQVWIAHTPPYTLAHLERLARNFGGHPALERRAAGRTVRGREMPLWTIHEGAADDKPVVWLMFRQHAWESGTSWAGDGAVRFLLGDSAEAARLRREAVWRIFPAADPDGVETGGVRFNALGYDLNRNWDAVDARRMPEIAGQRAAVAEWLAEGRRIDLFLTVHNTESGEYVEGPAEFRERIGRFRAALTRLGSFEETRSAPQDAAASTTPGMKGRMSVNQGLHAEFGVPALLMETRVEAHPKLGGRPRNIADWQTFGEGLVRALAEAVGL